MKLKKSVLALIVAVSVLCGMVIGVSGAELRETITATLRRDLNIEVNGEKQTLKDASGNVIYPIMYNNSTYIPFRAVGNLLDGVTVDWDQATQTAKYITTGTADPKPEIKGVNLIDNFDVKAREPDLHSSTIVPTRNGQKVQVNGQVLTNWIRTSHRLGKWGTETYVVYDLTGEFKTLTMTAFGDYDTTVTVYNNRTRDSVLGTFTVPAGKAVTETIQINGAVQISIGIISKDKNAVEENYIYLYDAYLQ